MRIPIPWLDDYVVLKEKSAVLAHDLTMRGIEVEGLDEGDPKSPVLDINVPSNRGDLLSVIGVAREIALLGLGKLRPAPKTARQVDARTRPALKVAVTARRACPLYTARVIRGMKVGPSPDWLVRRLTAAGLRSINNIVDATNYVMIGKGQPLHAFDADRLAGTEITVRQAAATGEPLKTLEGKVVTLMGDDLVIADGSGPLALAGIVGGMAAGVTGTTRSILLESAWFAPAGIRHTRRRLGLATESSARFERGIDPMGVQPALDEVTSLILQLAGGVPEGEVIRVGKPLAPPSIGLKRENLTRLIGVEIPPGDLAKILARLGGAVGRGSAKHFRIRVPSYRADLVLPEDIIEEVVRLWGIDQVPEIFPPFAMAVPEADPALTTLGRLKLLLQDLGFAEVLSYDFTSEREIANLAPSGIHPVEVGNPMGVEERFLRPTLLGGLLSAAARNQANQIGNLKLYEIGTVYHRTAGEVQESLHLGCLLVGHRDNVGLSPKSVPYDIFDSKGMLDMVLRHLAIEGEGCQALPVDPKVCGRYEVRGPAYYFELDLDVSARSGRSRPPSFTPLARFPASFRDMAVAVKKEVTAAAVLEEIRRGEKVLSAELFDCYEGPPVEAGHKSLAFHIRYGSPEATLTDDQVERCHRGVVAILERKFGARLR